MKHQQPLSLIALQASFPRGGKYANGPWKGQDEMMEFLAQNGSAVLESPTGSGKTAVAMAFLEASVEEHRNTAFFVTPNKTLVGQIKEDFPDVKVALGRCEHLCLYYEDQPVIAEERLVQLTLDPLAIKADDVPCSMLKNCPHRVDQATGETHVPGSTKCPYLQQKFEAKQGGVVVCTTSFYLFTQLFSHEFPETSALVIDEAHRIADIVRSSLSYDITDYHLERSIELLTRIDAPEVGTIEKFLASMKYICKKRKPDGSEERPVLEKPVILSDAELRRLMGILENVDSGKLLSRIEKALRDKTIDAKEDRVALKKLETLVRDLRRYSHSFEYSVETDERKPLNYTCAFYKFEKGERDLVECKLVVRCYYVAPLIRKILPSLTVAFSATIGDPEIFGHETGIRFPCLQLQSNFPSGNTRLYLPMDTPNLAMNTRTARDMTQSIRKIARACKRFALKGHRSLVVTISNDERDKFLQLAKEEGLKVVSYGNGVTAKQAAIAFKEGEGDCLVGTASNYAEGVDLPKQIAPIIFFLRPGYPVPTDPGTQFEEKRFGGARWALWNWRVMQQALQVRGRNVRSTRDVGVTFFISQQFKKIVWGALPPWLEKSYRSDLSFEHCIRDAEELLAKKE